MAAMVPFHTSILRRLYGPEGSVVTTVVLFFSFSFSSHSFHSRPLYMPYVQKIMENLPKWKGERLRPPRVNQSEVIWKFNRFTTSS